MILKQQSPLAKLNSTKFPVALYQYKLDGYCYTHHYSWIYKFSHDNIIWINQIQISCPQIVYLIEH